MTSREALGEDFMRRFAALRGQPIALYGLGPNTQHLLETVTGFRIVGLMDAENAGRRLFGLPVLSPEEAVAQVRAIVIVARAAVVPIIQERIAALCAQHGVAIYDLGGNLLSEAKAAPRALWRPRPGSEEASLRRAIEQADIVSFDIFDTLLLRRTARPENVFDLVEGRARRGLYPGLCFKSERMAAERALVDGGHPAPTLAEIYGELSGRLGLGEGATHALMAEEIAVEAMLLRPRTAMAAIFRETVASGKPVYLLSDMYLGRETLEPILAAQGIVGYRELLVSCDHGRTKRSGALFALLRERAGAGEILHVGDDPVADLEAPARLGLRCFAVQSGYEMLLVSAHAGLLAQARSAGDALAVGMIVARACNDPFLFHRTEGRLRLDSGGALGFVGFGALTLALLQWLLERTAAREGATILFGARDGWLFHRLYERVAEAMEIAHPARGLYFLTSRRAVTAPAVRSRAEILERVGEASGQPTFGEFLALRFGVAARGDDPRAGRRVQRESLGELQAFVLDYEAEILAGARSERAGYLRYVEGLELDAEGPLYLFDLITSGTIPHFLRATLGRELTCLCALMHDPPKYAIAFESFLGEAGAYDRRCNLLRGHYLAESLYTAPAPELERFTHDGEPLYVAHADSHSGFAQSEPVRAGIVEFVDEYLELASGAGLAAITPGLADALLGLILSEECLVEEALKEGFLVRDRYSFQPALNPWRVIPPAAGEPTA